MSDSADTGPNQLASNITAAREALGWSQRDLVRELAARGVNLSQANISNIEQGKRDPRARELKGLADVFGVSIDQLMGPLEVLQDKLVWSVKYAKVQDAKAAVITAAREYERMAEEIAEGANSPSELQSLNLNLGLGISCIGLATHGFNFTTPWREDYGINLRKGDPASDMDMPTAGFWSGDPRRRKPKGKPMEPSTDVEQKS